MSDNKRGQPRRFQSGKEFEESMMDYVSWCEQNQHMPNVAGFCVHCDMVYKTFYEQNDYYPESFEKVNMLLETSVINSKTNSDNFRAFYMKNKFRYTDKVQNEIFTPEPIKIQHIERLSDDELLALKSITKKIEDE